MSEIDVALEGEAGALSPEEAFEAEGEKIRRKQAMARDAGGAEALAHWSRERVRWLRAAGRLEVS